jgi:hypothetical protein
MPTKQQRALTMTAIVKDVLHALHLPGGETLGALVEKELRERNKTTLNVLLEELGKARDEGVTFEENDVHDFVQMVLRVIDATNKGTARRNLRLLAQVIWGLKRNRIFEFDRFQKWANVLETLTRDEILVLRKLYKLMPRHGDPWSLLKDDLVPGTFRTNAEPESVCASLLRTGLVLPGSAFGGLVYRPTESLTELGGLAELETDIG